MAIAVPDELQKSGGLGTNRALRAVCGRSVAGRDSSCKHRASGYALERCLKGFATLDGHKSMPSRESMFPGSP